MILELRKARRLTQKTGIVGQTLWSKKKSQQKTDATSMKITPYQHESISPNEILTELEFSVQAN